MSKQPTSGNGIGFLGVLTILFIGLKLTGYVNWPWIMVLSPLWLPLGILIIGVVLFLIGDYLWRIYKGREWWNK